MESTIQKKYRYNQSYQKQRYHSDPLYRQKKIESARRYQKKKKETAECLIVESETESENRIL